MPNSPPPRTWTLQPLGSTADGPCEVVTCASGLMPIFSAAAKQDSAVSSGLGHAGPAVFPTMLAVNESFLIATKVLCESSGIARKGRETQGWAVKREDRCLTSRRRSASS